MVVVSTFAFLRRLLEHGSIAFSWQGRRPEMGLGSLDAGVGLGAARAARDEARRILQSGRNPIEARREVRRATASKPTFGEIADALLEAKVHEWRNEKHRQQWRWSLTQAARELRPRPVDEVGTDAVLAVLKPLWTAKPETASRLRGRIRGCSRRCQGARPPVRREPRDLARAPVAPAPQAPEAQARAPRRDGLWGRADANGGAASRQHDRCPCA